MFGDNVSRVAFKRGAYLRSFVYTFAELLSDRLTRSPDHEGHDRHRLPTSECEPAGL